MSEEFNPYNNPNEQAQQYNQQPVYQQPVYQQPVYQQPAYPYPAPQPVKNSPAPCIVSMATGIAGFILTILSAIYTFYIFLVAEIGFAVTDGAPRNRADYAPLVIFEFVFVFIVAILLLFGAAASTVSLVFGIKGIKEQRRLRPMAIVGVVLSGISLVAIVFMAFCLIALCV